MAFELAAKRLAEMVCSIGLIDEEPLITVIKPIQVTTDPNMLIRFIEKMNITTAHQHEPYLKSSIKYLELPERVPVLSNLKGITL